MHRGPRGLALQGAPCGAIAPAGGQVLVAGLKAPPPPALLVQGQCPLQFGPARRLWGERFCLSLWAFTANFCWDVQRDPRALLEARTGVRGQGPSVEGEVFVHVQGLPPERPASGGAGLLRCCLRAARTGRLGRHSPGPSSWQRRDPARCDTAPWQLPARPSVRGAWSDVPGQTPRRESAGVPGQAWRASAAAWLEALAPWSPPQRPEGNGCYFHEVTVPEGQLWRWATEWTGRQRPSENKRLHVLV